MMPNSEQPKPLLPRGRTIAVFIGASVSFIAIGVFNLLAEASKPIKDFLTFSDALGPWSGKIVLGYALGIIGWLLAWLFLRNRSGNIVIWFWILLVSLTIGILLVFSPFLHLLL